MRDEKNHECNHHSICTSNVCPDLIDDCFLQRFMNALESEIVDKSIQLVPSATQDEKRRAIIHIARCWQRVQAEADEARGLEFRGLDDSRRAWLEAQLWHHAPAMTADFISDELILHHKTKAEVLLITEGPRQQKGRLTEMVIALLEAETAAKEVQDHDERDYNDVGDPVGGQIGKALGSL